MRSPTYATLEDWILGRILRHPSSQNSIPAYMLENPPEYLLANGYDARDELTKLRNADTIAAHSKRWYLTRSGRTRAQQAVRRAARTVIVAGALAL